jgi:hypothetical protein
MFAERALSLATLQRAEASISLTWMPQEVKETSSVNLMGREAMLSLLVRNARV